MTEPGAAGAAVGGRPPEELPAGAVTLLRYRGTESAALHRAVVESLEHLRPWMPWASVEEDPSEAFYAGFIGRMLEQWESGETFAYWARDDANGELLGSMGLHPRVGPGAIEIGYWVRVGHTGRGVATAAARALTVAGLGLPGVGRVEIHCDEANVRSAAVARRLGYALERVEDDEISAPGEVGRSMIWVAVGTTWPGST